MRNFQLSGHLGYDLELKTNGETVWTRLRVATNDGGTTEWFNVVAFGKLAEAMVEHLGKGDGVSISGRLKVNQYDGKDQVELIARSADFFPKGKKEED